MNEKITKEIEEAVSKTIVTRDRSVLRALGVEGIINNSYRCLKIRSYNIEEIIVCSETVKKVKACLINHEKHEFIEEDIREDYTNFRRFIFDFNDDGALITIVEGIRYPVTSESLQPVPNERRIKVNNAEIVGIICIINKFFELREHFYAVKKVAGQEIRDFLAQQLKRKLMFIRGLAEKYEIDIEDVLELMKDEMGIADDAFEMMKSEIDIVNALDMIKNANERKG